MNLDAKTTSFAPAERATSGDVAAQHDALKSSGMTALLDALPVMVVIINQERQIVFANNNALEATQSDMRAVLGKRPGEAFGCVIASRAPCGCGTSEFCSRCGAVRSILMGAKGWANSQECSLLVDQDGQIAALDLLVSSSPLRLDNWDLVVFTIQDRASQGRRRNLEHLFFHDVLNTVGSLRGLMDMLRQEAPENLKDDADFIHTVLDNLVDELFFHKELLAAENKELTPSWNSVRSTDLLAASAKMGQSLQEAQGKHLQTAPDSVDAEFISDARLVRRVLGNMIKNALEASAPGETVTLGCVGQDGGLLFWVRNSAVMSEDTRLQVFKRNFSTRGEGRGLGAYGMKLLGENHLEGRVGFTSQAALGTVFTLWLPLAPASLGELPDIRA